jgi:hypothetical protein
LPEMARALLRRWLALFDVTPRDDLARALSAMAEAAGASLTFERPFRGYAQCAVLTLPPEFAAFSSEVDTGSREENASNKGYGFSVLINQNRESRTP